MFHRILFTGEKINGDNILNVAGKYRIEDAIKATGLFSLLAFMSFFLNYIIK